jgi:hypothetical protein
VLPSKTLTSLERLGIYAHMYYARLIEVMEGEYPTTRQLLGEHDFAAACRRFIAKHPSRTRTLNSLSRSFRISWRRRCRGRAVTGSPPTSRASNARWRMCSMRRARSR